MSDVQFPEPLDPMDRAMQRMDKKAWAAVDAEIALLNGQLANRTAELIAVQDLLSRAARLLQEAHDTQWPFMGRDELGDRIGDFLQSVEELTAHE